MKNTVQQLLRRWSAYGPIRETIRYVTSGSARERHGLIADDFKRTKDAWCALAENKPASKKKKALLLSHITTVWAYKLDMVFALVLQRLGYEPVIVYADYDVWRERYHRLIGVQSFVDLKSYGSSGATTSIPAEPISAPQLLALTSDRIDVGRIVLSNIVYAHKFSKLEFANKVLQQEIRQEIKKVNANAVRARRLLAAHKPDLVVAIEKGLSPMAEVFGATMAAGIPFVQYANAQHTNDFMLKRYSFENRHQNPFSLDDSTWTQVKKMEWSHTKEEELIKDFEDEYKKGTWFNRKYLHEAKTIMRKDEVRNKLGLDPAKKTAVIFSHVLWDATFFYGKGLFTDYETWLTETIKLASQNPRVNWVIKLHPDLVWKLKQENVQGELRDLLVIHSAVGSLPSHIKIVMPETDIDTYSFFDITDYCLTVRGTIGIEMACRGIPVLTAGTGRYSGLGFTLDSSSIEQYSERLLHIDEIPPMDAQQIELARRFGYALFKKRPWTMNSFSVEKMKLEKVGHTLDTNVVPVSGLTEATLHANADVQALSEWFSSSGVDFVKPL